MTLLCDRCHHPLVGPGALFFGPPRQGLCVKFHICADCLPSFDEWRENPVRAVPMLLWCPECHTRHIDEGEFSSKIHHTHACQGCGHVWRPAIEPTVGVQFLPGFKNSV